MANSILVTDFTSKQMGTFIKQGCPMLATSYRGISEYSSSPQGVPAGFKPGNNVNIKIPGYPSLQLGLSVTPGDITDREIAYPTTDDDIYNVDYAIDMREMRLRVVGGRHAFLGSPGDNPAAKTETNPNAINYIDNYCYPAYTVIRGGIEKTIGEKANTAAWMTPVDLPSKVKKVDSYPSISAVGALMDKLGWINRRYAVANNDDATNIADSLQNMFNVSINTRITREARIGGPDKGRLAGFDMYTSNSLTTHIAGEQYADSPTFTVQSVTTTNGVTTIVFAGVQSVSSRLFKAGDKIAIPSVKLINKANKVVTNVGLVVSVAQDTNGVGDGTIAVQISAPLYASGMQANVDSLPAASAAAEMFNSHKNNYFYVPKGLIANPISMDPIAGAENSIYHQPQENVIFQTNIQGVNTTGVNNIRYMCFIPTLVVPEYIMWLPSPLDS